MDIHIMEALFLKTSKYENFSIEHWLPVVCISGIYFLILLIFRKKPESLKWQLAFVLSLIPCTTVILRMCFTWYEGIYSIKEELPLHLCRIAALVMPFLIYFKNHKWINTFYFLIIVGTLQAVVTADLEFGYPHYSYIIYWIFHVSLVWLPLYIIILMKITPSKSDMIRAFVWGNMYMLMTLIINFSIGSNYFYTRHKPPGGSLLDLFGPWPFYIFVVDVLAIVLFLLAYLPFHKKTSLNLS